MANIDSFAPETGLFPPCQEDSFKLYLIVSACVNITVNLFPLQRDWVLSCCGYFMVTALVSSLFYFFYVAGRRTASKRWLAPIKDWEELHQEGFKLNWKAKENASTELKIDEALLTIRETDQSIQV